MSPNSRLASWKKRLKNLVLPKERRSQPSSCDTGNAQRPPVIPSSEPSGPGRISQEWTGRGGAGNLRSPSRDRAVSGPEDYSNTRDRDPVPAGDPNEIISTGRGGRGNIRSPSRDPVYWGRITTGRGGVGNFRPPSCDRSVNGPEDYLDTRGRDGVLESDRNAVISTGRGGSGNIRSPSRDRDTASPGVSPARSLSRGRTYDRETIMSIDDARDTGVHSFGRVGPGNLTSSSPPQDPKFRSRSRERVYINTGRGGIGYMYLDDPPEKDIEELYARTEEPDESERASHSHELGMHSVDRGGYGNLTAGVV